VGNNLETLAATVAEHPDDAMVRMDYGVALAEAEQMREAVEQLEKAIEIDPELAEAHYNLGVIYGRVLLDDLAVDELFEDHTDEEAYFEKASASYKEALRLVPTMTAALNNLARLCDAMGLHGEAKRHFEASLAIDPEQPDVRDDLVSLEDRGAPEGGAVLPEELAVEDESGEFDEDVDDEEAADEEADEEADED